MTSRESAKDKKLQERSEYKEVHLLCWSTAKRDRNKTWLQWSVRNWCIYVGITMKLKTPGSRVVSSVGRRLIKWNMIAVRLRRWTIHWEIQYKINLTHETRKSRSHCIILKVNHKVLRRSYMRWSEKVINSHRNSLPTSQECFRSAFLKALSISDGEVNQKLNVNKKDCGVDGLTAQQAAWAAASLQSCRARPGGRGHGVHKGQMERAKRPHSHLQEPSCSCHCAWRQFGSCPGALCSCTASLRPFLLYLKPLIPGPLLPPPS